MQPGVTPGSVLELHAATANAGAGPGINAAKQEWLFGMRGSPKGEGTSIYGSASGAASVMHYDGAGVTRYASAGPCGVGAFGLAVTYDGSCLATYNAGAPVASYAYSYTPVSANPVVSVGSLQAVSQWSSCGYVVVRYYPFALTAEQVAANYAAGPAWRVPASGSVLPFRRTTRYG